MLRARSGPAWKIFASNTLCLAQIMGIAPAVPAAPAPETIGIPANQIVIPDVPLLNENGNPVRFSEFMKFPVVLINFVFTSCTTICVPLGANIASLSRQLGSRAGTDVRLVSISVDPITDNPERLRTWAAQFHPGPGWSLVTGSKPSIDELLKSLRFYTADKSLHTPMILIGRPATGEWIRTNGLAKPAVLAALVTDMLKNRSGLPPQ